MGIDSHWLILAFTVGFIQAWAPDHWLPSSVFLWQRRWSRTRSFVFSIGALAAHLCLGGALFALISPLVKGQGSSIVGAVMLCMVGSATLLRLFRFSRMDEVLAAGPHGKWGAYVVFSLLGPAELLVPVLLKAQLLGIPRLPLAFAFGVGTLLSGTFLIGLGQLIFSKPGALASCMRWVFRAAPAIPAAALFAVTVSRLFG